MTFIHAPSCAAPIFAPVATPVVTNASVPLANPFPDIRRWLTAIFSIGSRAASADIEIVLPGHSYADASIKAPIETGIIATTGGAPAPTASPSAASPSSTHATASNASARRCLRHSTARNAPRTIIPRKGSRGKVVTNRRPLHQKRNTLLRAHLRGGSQPLDIGRRHTWTAVCYLYCCIIY